jgi:WD40 repeat protein
VTARRLFDHCADPATDPIRVQLDLREAFELTVWYLGLVLLADSVPRGELPSSREVTILSLIFRPHTSDLVNLLYELSEARLRTGRAGAGVDLAGAFCQKLLTGAKPPADPYTCKRSPLLKECDRYVASRNEFAHGTPGARLNEIHRREVQTWLPVLLELLRAVAGMAGRPLVRITAPDRFERWMGPLAPEPESDEPGEFEPGQTGHFALLSPAGESPIDLDPFVLHSDGRVYVYAKAQRVSKARGWDVVLREYDSGEPIRRTDLSSRLEGRFAAGLLDRAFERFREAEEKIENRVVALVRHLVAEHADIVGRERIIGQITGFVADNPSGLVLIRAQPGMGKTALMSHLIKYEYGDWTQPPPAYFFFRRQDGITGLTTCHRTLYEKLLEAHHLKESGAEPSRADSPEEVYIKLTNLLAETIPPRLLAHQKQLVLIDALDEADRPDDTSRPGDPAQPAVSDVDTAVGIFQRLPSVLPRGVFMIVSTRPVAEADPLAERPGILVIDLNDPEHARENLRDGAAFVAARLDGLGMGLRERLSELAAGNFQLLTVICDTIRSQGLETTEIQTLVDSLAADALATPDRLLAAAYANIWRRMEDRLDVPDRTAVRQVAGVLAAALAPVNRDLLHAVLGPGAERWNYALLRLQEYLSFHREREPVAEAGGRAAVSATFVRIYHKSFADFIKTEITSAAEAHGRLADFCRGWASLPDGYPRAYAVRNGPAHMIRAHRRDDLYALLTNPAFLAAKARAGMAFELTQDLGRAVSAFPEPTPARRAAELLAEALAADLDFVHRHRDALPQCLYNRGWWYDGPDASACYDQADGHGPRPWESPILAPLLAAAPPARPWVRSLRPPPVHLAGPQQAVLLGHTDGIEAVDVSSDGMLLASGGGNTDRDTVVRVWDLGAGRLPRAFRGHTRLVHRVRFSPDGRRLVTAAADRTVRLWDVAEAREVARLDRYSGNVDCVAFDPTGSWLVTAARDGTVVLWPVEPIGEPIVLYRGESQGRGVGIHPDGRHVAVGFLDGMVRVWEVPSVDALRAAAAADRPLPVLELRGHEDVVYSVAFSPTGRVLASAGRDRTVRLWAWPTGKPAGVLRGHTHWIYTVAFSPDGKWLASASRDETVRVWQVGMRKELSCFRGHQGAVYSVAFRRRDRDMLDVVSGGGDGSIRIWRLEADPLRALPDHEAPIRCLTFSPDGSRVVTGAGHVYQSDHTIRVWDAADGRPIGTPLQGHGDNVLAVAASDGASRVVSGSRDRTLRVWDGTTGTELWCVPHPGRVEAVAVTPDGRWVATGSLDNTVRVWELRESGPVLAREFSGHTRLVAAVAFHPGQTLLASGGYDGSVWLWDLDGGSGDQLGSGLGLIQAVVFSPDGSLVAAQSLPPTAVSSASPIAGTAHVWDVEFREPLEPIENCWDIRNEVAAGARYRAGVDREAGETVFRHHLRPDPVAWFPMVLNLLTGCPGRPVWAGAQGHHLVLLELQAG